MANNPGEAPNHDFLEQLLEMQTYAAAAADPNLAGTADVNLAPMMLQLNSAAGGYHASPPVFPLGLSLDQGKPAFLKPDEGSGSGSGSGGASKRFREDMVDASKNVFQGQPMPSPVPAVPHQAAVRPRVRARRGQATDPHSIAERLRRERIAERIRALQDLVPSVNKTDRAAMLDEIVDYVKFLRLQVKEEGSDGGQGQPVWEKWSNDGTERQVAKLMEENVGAAMQFLQSKALCIMPISLASAIYHTQPPDAGSLIKPESNPPP
ncbi:hypothetical protein Cgig2_016978 [Carnegiea gigantea]|uniref:BHLH domain-containing protein n=1 Tax=Carnegiea gigantea TaxID=171969 RepID=A0A9Q1KH93_9CARY|nr:hypothetical protein Cgig2_016978 [Carnegiea gigantea]